MYECPFHGLMSGSGCEICGESPREPVAPTPRRVPRPRPEQRDPYEDWSGSDSYDRWASNDYDHLV